MIGRDPKTVDFATEQTLEQVSRKHCHISYDPDLGWLIFDEFSSSGTWAHLKTYEQARWSIQNSNPVKMWNKMVVKAFTFTFEFKE